MARQYHRLWPLIVDFNNLWRAWQAAAKGKSTSDDMACLSMNAEPLLFDLQRSLEARTYRPAPYHSFWIQDPKRRWVSAAAVLDRVVHHAVVQVLEPIFEPTFAQHSYANRKGKGTHAAVAQAQQWAQQHRYVLQCDIRQFFPSIDHAVLRHMLHKKVGCPHTLWLMDQIIGSGAGILDSEYDMVFFEGDDLLACERPRGLPIGNLTSQFWANVYMNELDQFVLRELRCKAYLRYVDDFLLFASDKKTLWHWKMQIRTKLDSLRLRMHEASSTVYPVSNGMPFLGMRVFATHMRLKTRNARAFESRMRKWHKAYALGRMNWEDMQRRMTGWVAHASHADTVGLRTRIFSKPWLSAAAQPKTPKRQNRQNDAENTKDTNDKP